MPEAADSPQPLNLAVWTVPNMITMSRFVIAPITLTCICVGYWNGEATILWVALGLMIVSEITDFLDGQIARRTGTVSDTGKMLDPLSDVISHNFVYLAFLAITVMPVWMLAVMLFREFTIAYARVLCALQRVVLQARWSGKIKSAVIAVSQFGTVILLALGLGGTFDDPGLPIDIAWWLLLGATFMVAYSMVDYLIAVAGMLRKIAREASENASDE